MVRLQRSEHLLCCLGLPTFNPTMVRLQQGMPRSAHHSAHHFQSHYGAIATSSTSPGVAAGVCFQSHYGAIATQLRNHPKLKQLIFQSHYGAIATGVGLMDECSSTNFQSHYGAIATDRLFDYVLGERTPFNPTMVRLQRCEGRGSYSIALTFNPTMVRLQRTSGLMAATALSVFQSHYGAIATRCSGN